MRRKSSDRIFPPIRFFSSLLEGAGIGALILRRRRIHPFHLSDPLLAHVQPRPDRETPWRESRTVGGGDSPAPVFFSVFCFRVLHGPPAIDRPRGGERGAVDRRRRRSFVRSSPPRKENLTLIGAGSGRKRSLKGRKALPFLLLILSSVFRPRLRNPRERREKGSV